MSLKGIRNEYAEIGVEKFYQLHGSDYRNPHEEIIARLVSIAQKKGVVGKKVLDLCCGSGEVTLALKQCEVIGVDPFTTNAHYSRTGKLPLQLSFTDIAMGRLSGQYDSVICSFALHLCPESMLPTVLWNLSEVSDTLVVISPNKRPYCDNISGWIMVDETIVDRVRMRIYCC